MRQLDQSGLCPTSLCIFNIGYEVVFEKLQITLKYLNQANHVNHISQLLNVVQETFAVKVSKKAPIVKLLDIFIQNHKN